MIRKHRKHLQGFSIGLAAAAVIGGASFVHASVTAATSAGVTQAVNAALTSVTHADACVKVAGVGTAVFFANGVKNTGTAANGSIDLLCPLVMPSGGWNANGMTADYAGADVNDQNDNTSGGQVIVKSCYLNRTASGTACSTNASTPGTSVSGDKGLFGVNVGMPTGASDGYSSRYVYITIPPQDGTGVSLVRDFGYFDISDNP